MSRLVYSTFVPSIESTEILLSPSRVTSAIVPSGVKVTWLVPDFSSAIVTLPTGVTVLPEIVNTDTVPSLRLATSASVPWRLIEMPAALLPASSVVMTAGGEAVDTTGHKPATVIVLRRSPQKNITKLEAGKSAAGRSH